MMLKYSDFLTKLFCMAVLFFIFACYQNTALKNEQILAENEKAVAEVEAQNAALQAEQEAADAEAGSGYKDGSYEGEGAGFGGNIKVAVTVAGGKITAIEVEENSGEDPAYFEQAEQVIDDMITVQGTDVDTISGATFSSTGLITAVDDALGKAVE